MGINPIKEKTMNGNLKVLGLAIAAVFATSAVAASTASAQLGKFTADGPVTLTGTETGPGPENSSTGPLGFVIECPGTTYTGHKVAVTPHEPVPVNATEITITPKYVNCNHAITMNGCDYVYRDATTTGGVAGTFGVVIDIVCPAGKDITIANPLCSGGVAHIPAQTGLTGHHLTHTSGAADDIELTGTTNVTWICSGVHTTAVHHVDVTFKGHHPVTKVNTPVTITD